MSCKFPVFRAVTAGRKRPKLSFQDTEINLCARQKCSFTSLRSTKSSQKMVLELPRGGEEIVNGPAERSDSRGFTASLYVNASTCEPTKPKASPADPYSNTHTPHPGKERGGKKREGRLCLTVQRCSKNSSLAPWPPAWLSWRQNHRR